MPPHAPTDPGAVAEEVKRILGNLCRQAWVFAPDLDSKYPHRAILRVETRYDGWNRAACFRGFDVRRLQDEDVWEIAVDLARQVRPLLRACQECGPDAANQLMEQHKNQLTKGVK